MSKKDEALKLALEALEVVNRIDLRQVNEAITAICEALAEQPAQQDMPKIGCVNHDCDKCKEQQQEPVAYIKTWHKNGEQHADIWQWEVGIEALKDGNHYLYTSPPASKPWVGLTDDEVAVMMMEAWGCASIAPRHAPAFAQAIEAKLREKNA